MRTNRFSAWPCGETLLLQSSDKWSCLSDCCRRRTVARDLNWDVMELVVSCNGGGGVPGR